MVGSAFFFFPTKPVHLLKQNYKFCLKLFHDSHYVFEVWVELAFYLSLF